MRRRFLTKTGHWANLARTLQVAEMNLGAFLLHNKASQISPQKRNPCGFFFISKSGWTCRMCFATQNIIGRRLGNENASISHFARLLQ